MGDVSQEPGRETTRNPHQIGEQSPNLTVSAALWVPTSPSPQTHSVPLPQKISFGSWIEMDEGSEGVHALLGEDPLSHDVY